MIKTTVLIATSSLVIHWTGFLATCLMLIAAFLDQSKDEFLIHFAASMIPNTLCWAIASFIAGRRKFFPFMK